MVEDSKLFEPVPQEGSEQPSAMEGEPAALGEQQSAPPSPGRDAEHAAMPLAGVVEIAEAAVPEAAEDQALKGSYEARRAKHVQARAHTRHPCSELKPRPLRSGASRSGRSSWRENYILTTLRSARTCGAHIAVLTWVCNQTTCLPQHAVGPGGT